MVRIFSGSWFSVLGCINLFFSSCSRLFEIVFVSFKLISGFLCVSGSFSCCGLLQVFKVVFCLRCSSVVAGCCKLFLLYCRFQVASVVWYLLVDFNCFSFCFMWFLLH